MHDNRFWSLFKKPYVSLKSAGLQPGQQVLEVGCGPGFYTLPAAEIVGNEGRVFATDVNPWAIRRVKEKVNRQGISNVRPMLVNAAESGLPGESVDLAFLFGLPRVAGGLDNLISELARVIKPGGIVSFQKRRRSDADLVETMRRAAFSLLGRDGRILKFQRKVQSIIQ